MAVSPQLREQARQVARAELIRRGLREAERIDAEIPPEWFHDGQLRAWNSDATDTVCSCGTQGGKTAFNAPWLLREIQRCFPFVQLRGRGAALYVGPTLTLLEEQALPAFEDFFVGLHKLGTLTKGNKPKFRFSKEGLMKVFGTDRYPFTVSFAYANDSNNLESVTACCGVWDEAGQSLNKLSSYRAFNRRLKAARSQGFGRRLWTTTPYEWGWFKTYVVDPAIAEENDSAFLNWPSWMNPIVDEAECRAELANGMPKEEWEMMYLGLFRRPRGLIYDCLDEAHAIVPSFPIPEAWKRYVGVDFGPVNTASVTIWQERAPCEWEVDGFHEHHTGVYYVGHTYHAGFKREQEAHIRDILGMQEKGVMRGLPTHCRGGNPDEDGWRIAFAKCGMPIAAPTDRKVEVGIQHVYRAFKTGRLKVMDHCTELIEELNSYSREIGDDGEPTDAIKDKSDFHLMDCLRYIVPALPVAPVFKYANESQTAYSLAGAA